MTLNQIGVTEGSGKNVATETIGTVDYGLVKVVDGRTGSTTGMRVNTDGSLSVSVIGTVTLNPTSISGTAGASIIGVVPVTMAASVGSSLPPGSFWMGMQGAGGSLLGVSTALFLADGTASNTLPAFAPYGYNGASWDRLRATIGSGLNVSVMGVASVRGDLGASIIGVAISNQADGTGAIAQLAVTGFNRVYNGSNWDRLYGNSSVGARVSFGIRNDNLASIYGTDGVSYQAAMGPAGEVVTANAPFTKWVQGTADLRGSSGGSVTVIAAQGSSVFTYITGVQIANMGSASVLVTLSGATSSIIGYSIAPAGGGSNIVYTNALKTNANGAFSASISGIASVLVSAQGFIAKI